MAEREERESIRCQNRGCPSRRHDEGRIIGERGLKTGWFYKKIGRDKEGRDLEAVALMQVTLPCEACGQSWLNPSLALFDGVTQVMERISERLAGTELPLPRRGLRPAA